MHGDKLGPLVRFLNRNYRDEATLSACGDVNRNVMASPVDGLLGPGDPRGRELAVTIADELAPRSSAYFQVFLTDDDGRTVAPMHSDEPLYGPQYLPRKFKIGIAHPDDNSIDALTQDVGLIPVLVNGSSRRLALGPLLRRRSRPVAQQSADRAAARHVPRPHRRAIRSSTPSRRS